MNAVIPLPKEMQGTPDSSDFPETSDVADTGIAVAVPGEAITVSDGAWFLRAEYERAGPDLHLTGPEGQQLVIRDYFNQVPPPDLMTADGVILKGNVATQLAGPIAPAQFAQAAPGSASEPIGRVETAAGQVQATRTDGTQVTLNQGDNIFAGDILETGTDGTVGIVFADESTFSLGEDGRMTLDEMIYDPGSQEGSMSVNLLQGAFTFVSGQIAKTDVDAMNIITPTTTIGIRGTAGGGHIDLEGVTTAALLPEIGFIGEMTLFNAAGSQTINQPGQAINIASANSPPSPPFILTPQQMGQTFGSALSALPNADAFIQNDIIQGANEGRQQQAEAEQAAADAEAQQAEAETKTAEAAAAAEAAQAEAEAAQAAAELAAAAAQADGATEAEIAAAEAAAELAAEANAAAAAAEAAIAEAEAELAAAVAELAVAQASVLETSAGGAVAAAAIEAGIDVPGVSEINDARAAVQEAQAAAAEAQAEAEVAQAEAEAQIAEAQAAAEEALTEAEALAAEAQAVEAEALAEAVANAEAEFQAQIEAEIQAQIEAQIEAEIQAQIEESINAGADEDEFFDTTSEFQEVLNASVGDDNLFGGDGNTQFSMVQGTSLGGIDVVDGGAGTDEISLENLSDFEGEFDIDNQSMTYSFDNSTTPTSGSILLTSVEQLYADNGTESSVRLNIDGASAGSFGYIVAGNSGNNTISVANGSSLSSIGASISDSTTVGSILFGGGGNDTITGSSAEDIIFGGIGYDTLTGGAGSDSLHGGAGNDTIYADGVDFIDGGTGTDTLTLSNNSDTVTVLGVETITGGSGNDVVSMDGDALTTNYINSITGVELIQAGAGDDSVTFSNASHSTALDGTFETITGGSGNDTLNLSNNGNTLLDVSGVETINGGSGIDVVTVTGSSAVDIHGGAEDDTLTGGSGADYLVGEAGADVLTGGGGSDRFDYTAASESDDIARDTISDFDATDDSEKIFLDGLKTGTFSFVGASAFSSGGNTEARFDDTTKILEIDTNGDGAKDMEIELTGVSLTDLAAGDFLVTGAGDVVFNYSGSNSYTLTGSNDLMFGSSGADVLSISGTGTSNDTVDSGAGTDSITINGAMTLNVLNTEAINGSAGGDTLTLANTLSGVALRLGGGGSTDTINLADGGNNVTAWEDIEIINGGSGNDVITADTQFFDDITQFGGGRTRTYDLGAGTDSITMLGTNDGIAIANVETIDGGAGTDRIALIDSGTSTTVISVETILGGAGTDTILLGGTSSTISLSAVENITASSGARDVTLTSTLTSGNISLGADDDTLTVSTATVNNSVTIDLGTESANDTLILSDGGTITDANLSDVTGLETLTLADAITTLTLGSNADTAFDGVSGTIVSASTSTVQTINASATSIDWTFNMLNASGADTLTGGSGSDTIIGGAGADILTGGAGSDIFKYTTVTDSVIGALDHITDFVAGGIGDQIDTNSIGTLAVIGDQATGDTLANLTLSALNILANTSTGSLTTTLTGDVTNTEVMQLTTTDSKTVWAIDVDASGTFDGSDTIIDVTGLTGTIDSGDFV